MVDALVDVGSGHGMRAIYKEVGQYINQVCLGSLSCLWGAMFS